MTKGRAIGAALLLAAAWAGCGDGDDELTCDEARGFVCRGGGGSGWA
jgi:hypothetical protein